MSRCDCGAIRARTTHADWCSTKSPAETKGPFLTAPKGIGKTNGANNDVGRLDAALDRHAARGVLNTGKKALPPLPVSIFKVYNGKIAVPTGGDDSKTVRLYHNQWFALLSRGQEIRDYLVAEANKAADEDEVW